MASSSMLVKIIIALISMLLLIAMIISLAKIPTQKQSDLDCTSKIKTFIAQSSFENKLRSSTKIADLFIGKNNNIECSANKILITESDEDKIYETFANEFVKCYNSWTTDNGDFENIFSGDGVFCNVCSIITFDPNVFDNIDDSNIPLSYDKFEDYINTHNYLDKDKGLIPYSRYLGKQTLDETSKSNFISGDFTITPDTQYSIMMKYIRGEKELETFYSSTKNQALSGTYVFATTAIGVKGGAMLGTVLGPVGSIIGGAIGGVTGAAFGLFRMIVTEEKPEFDWIGQIFITDVASAKLDNIYKCEILLGM